ncbi:vacuolar protein sorting 35 [Brevipalpus obovatus]|uniref:vacuolar protein sorting 35 n=1 Tax=Brevipalpus obovatus TaxID=246614 RepID=UPI003D9DC7D2
MPQTPISSPTEQRQEKKLEEALANVQGQSFQMKCCLDKLRLMEALKHASTMISELRTNLLSPKAYYELYMAVCDQLRHLEIYLSDEFSRGRKIPDLYDLVQYAGNIIPRHYLLITVGLVYMKTTPGCRRDILKDLVEMCRGVQHPLRGLFLRNYLLQSCRNILPDVVVEDFTGAEGGKEDHSGTIEDSIDFILLNFAEMNKLWVRMQHQGHTRDKDRREKERLELRLLVGTNLVRLSQLESIDIERYKNIVLPGILEQVVSCRDSIAQEYLMECVIQVFPDEFHLATLQPFLNSCAQLVSTVNVTNIIIGLIDRLAASKDVELPDDLFEIFSNQISNIIKSRLMMPLDDIILMEGSLIRFCMVKISDREDRYRNIDSVYETTLLLIKEKCGSRINSNSNIGKVLMDFLALSLPAYSEDMTYSPIKMSLKLPFLMKLVKESTDSAFELQFDLLLINFALDFQPEEGSSEEHLLELDEIRDFLKIVCEPFTRYEKKKDEEDEAFADDQRTLGRFIHYLLSPFAVSQSHLDLHYLILEACKEILSPAGQESLQYIFPPIIFELLRLALKYSQSSSEKWKRKVKAIYQLVHNIMLALNDSNCPGLCLRLYLQAALNANKTEPEMFEIEANEFAEKAASIYEDEISDSKERLSTLLLIIGALKEMKFKNDESIEALRSQCPRFASRLLRKTDQVRALLQTTHLFCDSSVKVLKIVDKCEKIASSLMDDELKLQLFVEIFTHLTLISAISEADIQKQVMSINQKITELRKESNMSELIENQYNNMLTFFKNKKLVVDDESDFEYVDEKPVIKPKIELEAE